MFTIALLRDTVGQEWLRTQVAFHRTQGKPNAVPALPVLWADAIGQAVLGAPPMTDRAFRIQQVVPDDFRFASGAQRVDRCMSCHLAIDDPDPAKKATKIPHPFRAHPGDLLARHPVEKFGCTICHHGQGIALRADAAHGYEMKRVQGKDGRVEVHQEAPVHHLDTPMLLGNNIEAACIKCHQGGVVARRSRAVDHTAHWRRGKKLFLEFGCIGCHSLHGEGGQAAPDLTEVASKFPDQFMMSHLKGLHTVQNWIYEHFLDPQAVVTAVPEIDIHFPSDMPNAEQFGMSEADARDLTVYLLSLTDEKVYAKYVTPAEPEREPVFASRRERGRYLYRKLGCIGCHGREGYEADQRTNWNAVGGKVPKLGNLADKYTREELRDFILRGSLPPKADEKLGSPPLWMPEWRARGLKPDELEAVMDHLFTIKLKKKAGEEDF